MDSLFSSLHGLISYAMPMIVLLGLLIFVHELGHFLVAKYYKVRVEVFSLGFGPKIFKFKRGDTVYAISAIPLGGYVKMFGDDPTADVASDHKQYSFNHKPVGQRIAIVLAGPLMNLFFAIVLFTGVATLGEQALSPKLGDIAPTSTAYLAGFRSGDTIVSISGRPVKAWDDLQKAVETHADRRLSITLERASGAQETIEVTPKLAKNKNVLSWNREVGEIEGLSPSSRAAVIGIKNIDSLAATAGLQTGDIIASVNGAPVARWRDFTEALDKSHTDSLSFEIERGILDDEAKEPTKMTLTVTLPKGMSAKPATEKLAALGIEFPELYLASIEKDSPAAKAGLQKGDRLLSINGSPIENFEQVSTTIKSYGQSHQGEGEQAPLSMIVSREGKEVALNVFPNIKERMSPQGREERRFEVGIRPMVLEAVPSVFNVSYSNPIAAIERGIEQTWKWTSLTVLSFVRLFQAEVSPKNIGGFLSIGQMAKKSWQVGASQFLSVMAIISINLFILNLLPVPVLDGGHLVFYSIEALRGAPLSMRKMEIAQQVGLFLLLALMVFALFNDVTRLFN